MKNTLPKTEHRMLPEKTGADIIPISTKIYQNKESKIIPFKEKNKPHLPLFDTHPIFKQSEYDSL